MTTNAQALQALTIARKHANNGAEMQSSAQLCINDALNTVMRMDVKGHQLQDRLQFSDPGRAIRAQAHAALDGAK